MPPTRTSTSRSHASGTSEAAHRLGAVTVVDARQNQNLPGKGYGPPNAERSRTSAAAFSSSGTIGHFTQPPQSRSGPGGLAPPASYASKAAGQQRSPPSVAASTRKSVYQGSKPAPSVIDRGAPGMPNHYAPYNTGYATNRSTAPRDGGRDRQVLPKQVFRRGLIIRGPLHEQDYQGASSQSNYTVAVTNNNRTESRFGPIHTKVRKMIVVECYQDHYIAVPLFTHGGRGLTNKRAPEEFIRLVHS